jgi:hypothetical protein
MYSITEFGNRGCGAAGGAQGVPARTGEFGAHRLFDIQNDMAIWLGDNKEPE